MDLPSSYRSFVVRLWREPSKAGGAWRGEVESIQSGELVVVDSLEQALAILRRAAAPPAASSDHSDLQEENSGRLV